ncbi:MAG TPA: UbiA family prenyltransferase [Acidobacteriaceae bacterium]|nr:UbiA family prenyltransferase [Acidobacteriaceae bacterium]
MTDPKVLERPASTELMRPLCVDLDGTLVKSDTLVDSLALLVRRDPKKALRAPLWALQGKAHLKAQLGALVSLDVENLPYNRPLLDYLIQQHAAGRKLYLATGADGVLAERIAAHLGIFEGVFASDGRTNLTGNAKLRNLEGLFAAEGFDYIGNAMPDLPLLMAARQAMVANPNLRLSGALRARRIEVSNRFIDRAPWPLAAAKAIRIHQWAKNALIFLPLLLAHALHWTSLAAASAAFVCFCLAASATYIFNDLLDLEADRLHRSKRRRPFAAGNLSVLAGVGISLSFLGASLALACFLPRAFLIYLLLYLGTTVAYSFALKRVVLVDVIVLSGLYTIRMLAGAAATYIPVSPWLAAFSIFLFLSLAMVKRFSELQNLHERGITPANGRGYLLTDIEQMRSFGTSSAYASVLIFALYINGRDVAPLYHHPGRMWLVTPLLILWLSRIWLLASRGVLDEDPVVFALTDRMSLLMALGVALIAFSAL